MPSLLELSHELNRGTVRVRGTDFGIRGLSGAETARLTRLFPPPTAPRTLKDPTRGSAAPLLPDENDPKFVADMNAWTRQRWTLEIAVSQDLVSATDDAAYTRMILEVGDQLASKLTEQEILKVWSAVRGLPDSEAGKEAFVVDLAKVPEDEVAEVEVPPEKFGTTTNYLDCRIAERFKQNPVVFIGSLDAGWRMLLRNYEKFRQWEESKRA